MSSLVTHELPGPATGKQYKGVHAQKPNTTGSLSYHAKEYFWSFLPRHVRRKGWGAPPIKETVTKFASYVTLPYFPWATMDWRKYPQHLPSDLLAGVTVGIMLVPQGLAYSTMATLPPIYGLYAATIAGYVYSIFGTSGQLTLGPVALVSLFMSQTFTDLGISLAPKSKTDPAANYATHVRAELAAVISLAVGILLCAMAFLRVGSLMRFISPSVLVGFVTGSGVYIFISQSKYLFGLKVPRNDVNYVEFGNFFKMLANGEAKHYDTTIGLISFFILLTFYFLRKGLQPRLREMRRTRPGLAYFLMVSLASSTLITIIIMTFITQGLHEKGHDIVIVGQVPAGFNKFQLPAVHNSFYGEGVPFSKVLWVAIPVTFLTYMESISVARKYAVVNKYALDATQELWALGLGCLAASFFQAYPPGGSFSRTALKADVGVKTPLANIVTSLFVTIVLMAATSLLTYVPQAVLGAVICTAVITLMDFGDMWRALWVAPLDFLVMMFTFAVTTVGNVEKGLIWGIVASVVILMVQISRLDMDSVGQLKLESRGKNVPPHLRPMSKHYPALDTNPHIKVLRLTANLFFGNVSSFRDEFYASLATEGPTGIRAVVVDAAGVAEIDLSALAVIDEMIQEVNKQGVKLYVAGAHDRIIKSLENFELLEEVGGQKLVSLDVEDVFVHVAEELDLELFKEGGRSRSNTLTEASIADRFRSLEEAKSPHPVDNSV